MTDLAALRERVREARGPDRELDADIASALHVKMLTYSSKPGTDWIIDPPITASIDAALALVERLLPGWRWVIHSARQGLAFGCSLADPRPGGIMRVSEKWAPTVPLAVLDALLSALIARDGAAA